MPPSALTRSGEFIRRGNQNQSQSGSPALPETLDIETILDPWGHPIRYERLNATNARLISPGPDGEPGTRWDHGLAIKLELPEPEREASWTDALRPETTWLERRRKELRAARTEEATDGPISTKAFSGGQLKLQGSAYFDFFTRLMLATAIAFIPFALLYRPRTVLQD